MTTLIHSYEELRQVAAVFAEGDIQCLVLLGAPGLGKSHCFQEALPDFPPPETIDPGLPQDPTPAEEQDTLPEEILSALGGVPLAYNGDPHWWQKVPGRHAKWFNTRISAIQMFINLYWHLDAPIVFDDVDAMHADKLIVSLLKSVTDTKQVRKVCWYTSSKELRDSGVPKEFETRSKICVIANDWGSLDKNLGALEDRAIVVKFVPPNMEVHQEVRRWFDDEEIYNFVGENLDRIHALNQRHYVKARQLKASGKLLKRNALVWKDWLEAQFAPPDHLKVVRDLRKDPNYQTEAERFSKFFELTGQSRATYFRCIKELREQDSATEAYQDRRRKRRRKS